MSRKQCRRKHYALSNPVAMAISGAHVTTKDDLDKLRMLELSQIDALAKGAATLSDLRHLADMLNLCETMGHMGIGKAEVLPACATCQEALLAIMRRFERWQKLEATPTEMEAIREVFRYHDLQRQSISRGEYERAIVKTANRIRSAHPSCKVIA